MFGFDGLGSLLGGLLSSAASSSLQDSQEEQVIPDVQRQMADAFRSEADQRVLDSLYSRTTTAEAANVRPMTRADLERAYQLMQQRIISPSDFVRYRDMVSREMRELDEAAARERHIWRMEQSNRPSFEDPYARRMGLRPNFVAFDEFDSIERNNRQKENFVTKTYDLRDPVRKEIGMKYKIMRFSNESDYPTNSNIVADSFLPAVFNSRLGAAEPSLRRRDINFPTSTVAISRFAAITLGVKQVHVSELVDMLGYTEKQIKEILLEVKRKELDLTLAGFGGTGVNFNYWLSELAGWTETVNIFRYIYVYDADKFSLSNIPRIPFYLEDSQNMNLEKVAQFDNTRHICQYPQLISVFIDPHILQTAQPNMIFYGAPDIRTRQLFSEHKRILVSATHQNESCSLDLNPMQNDALQIETYGKIDLSSFFMNHLMMTIKFLEWMASTDLTDMEYMLSSSKIMDYTFEKREYHTKKRMYRFPTSEHIDTRGATHV